MRGDMTNDRRFRTNVRLAKRLWPGQIQRQQVKALETLSHAFRVSLADGDFQLLEGRWYVTHSGLLRVAQRAHCFGITTALQRNVSDPAVPRWVFKAVVFKRPGSPGFVGFGDADCSNVSPLVRGAVMRIAETRAVNRALRKAYGIGLCSVEELGYLSSRSEQSTGSGTGQPHSNGNNSGNGHPRLRDRLCLFIRQHQLDTTLVKRYAADLCGTQELREASRDLVESFIIHLAEWAAKDRAGLVCKLNSYAQAEEVRP